MNLFIKAPAAINPLDPSTTSPKTLIKLTPAGKIAKWGVTAKALKFHRSLSCPEGYLAMESTRDRGSVARQLYRAHQELFEAALHVPSGRPKTMKRFNFS